MQILVRLDRDKNSSVNTASALVASEKRCTVGLCFLYLFVTKVTNRTCKWRENYGGTCFIFKETNGRTFYQKDYQSSLWVRRDLWLDLFYFLVVIQSANTWLRKKKKNSASFIMLKSWWEHSSCQLLTSQRFSRKLARWLCRKCNLMLILQLSIL